MDPVVRIEDVLRKHESVQLQRLEEHGEAEVGTERNERAEQHVSLPLGPERQRGNEKDEEGQDAERVDDLEERIVIGQRAREEGGRERIYDGEREQPMRAGDLQARPVGDRRRSHQNRDDRTREQQPVRRQRSRHPQLLPVSRERREEDGCA